MRAREGFRTVADDAEDKPAESHSPGHDDDKIKLVPLVAKVTIRAENPQRHHLDDHFHREESKDAVVQDLEEQGDRHRQTGY